LGDDRLRAHLGSARRPDGLQLLRQRPLLRRRDVCLRDHPARRPRRLLHRAVSRQRGRRASRGRARCAPRFRHPRSARTLLRHRNARARDRRWRARRRLAIRRRRRRMVPPLFPGEVGSRETFFYYLCFALAALTLPFLRWLYSSRFGLVLNAIRDDEDKAEAMGLRTTRYKTAAWCISAFFLGLSGGAVGNLLGFVDPREVAFAGSTFGVWMVLMAILGGKGTLWGPVLGAAIFHVTKELFWTYLLGWQRVALGLLIVVIVVFFPRGILGWARRSEERRVGKGGRGGG